MIDHTQIQTRPKVAADPDHAWLDVHIVGNDEACEALVQTNDNLDFGHPTLYADWILTYTAGDGQTAIAKALATHGRSHTTESGTTVTVTVNKDV
jgi:hypothetical protein